MSRHITVGTAVACFCVVCVLLMTLYMFVGSPLGDATGRNGVGGRWSNAERSSQHQQPDSYPTPPYQPLATTDQTLYAKYGEGDFQLYDPFVLNYIRSHMSRPSPSRPRSLEAKQTKDGKFSQIGQEPILDRLLGVRRNGFFVECGAADGEGLSNTLFFELERNWTGLLIEGNPSFHRALLGKNRNAVVLRACLGTQRRPSSLLMKMAGLGSGITELMHKEVIKQFGLDKYPEAEVSCFPLNAIAAAIGVSHIDFLSLDVEGPEVEIMESIDWSRLRIDVIMMEYGEKVWKLNKLRSLFNATGLYREAGILPEGRGDGGGQDVIFQRKG